MSVTRSNRFGLSAIVGLALTALPSASFGQTVTALMPPAQAYFTANDGTPLAGGLIYTYLSGTSTPQATYTDATGTVPNANPVVLNSAGRASIWLNTAVLYRIVVKTSLGVTLYTADGVFGTASSTGGALWSLNSTTLYNSAGSKVCISTASGCTTALALLNVSGASSGSAHLFRIDDTANAPGIDLYGSGASMGSLVGDSTGLKLVAASGASQLYVTGSGVTIQSSASGSPTVLTIKETTGQGTTHPLDVQNSAGTNLAWIDASGNGFMPGLQISGTATNSLQAPSGGVYGQWLIAADSLFLLEEPAPAVSGAGQARIYADSTSHTLNVSQNGGAYVPLGSGGSGGSFTGITTGANTTATMTVGAGATLTFSTTGVVNASQINATTVPASSAADQLLGTSASGTGAWLDVPDCPDSAQHLNFTHAGGFTCGTSGGTVGSVAFSAITGTAGAPNTSAAMVLGTGASLSFSGTGTVNANLFNSGTAPVSGSIWKSDSTLKPVAALYSDVVGLFSGGAGCSGTNALAANGTCVAVGGGSSLLASNNTWTGTNAFTNSTTMTTLNASGAIQSTVTGSSVGLQVNGGQFQAFGNGNVNAGGYVNTAAGYQLGGTAVIDGTRTINATTIYGSANLSMGLSGSFGTYVDVNNTTSGRVTLGPAEWQPLNTNTVSLGDVSHVFSQIWGRTLQLEGGINLNYAGAGVYALIVGSGVVAFTGTTTIVAPGGTTLNGTFTCPSGQHFNQLVISQGLVTNYSCN